jgi:hypothetical protein
MLITQQTKIFPSPEVDHPSTKKIPSLSRVNKGTFYIYFIQRCFICRPSDSTVSEDHLSKNSNSSSEKFQFIFPRAAIRLLVTRSLPINSNKQSSNHPYIHFPIIQHYIFPSPAINLSITWSLIFSLQAVNILFINS